MTKCMCGNRIGPRTMASSEQHSLFWWAELIFIITFLISAGLTAYFASQIYVPIRSQEEELQTSTISVNLTATMTQQAGTSCPVVNGTTQHCQLNVTAGDTLNLRNSLTGQVSSRRASLNKEASQNLQNLFEHLAELTFLLGACAGFSHPLRRRLTRQKITLLRTWFFELLLRAGLFLHAYRVPFLSGSASFFVGSSIAVIYDVSQGLNPLTQIVPTSNFVIGIMFLLLWFASAETTSRWVKIRLGKARAKARLVGIFYIEGMKDEKLKETNLLRGTKYTPLEWKQRLESKGFSCTLISDCSELDRFSFVVNPFGEIYLEHDFANMESFRRIKNYIMLGGKFVNVGGLAFFYALNPKPPGIEMLTGNLIETSELVSTASGNVLNPIILPEDSSLVDTLLFREFGVRTTVAEHSTIPVSKSGILGFFVDDMFSNSLETPSFSVEEFRAAVRTESALSRLIPILRHRYVYKAPQPWIVKVIREAYTIAALSYGAGYLLLFGMLILDEQTLDYVVQCMHVASTILESRGEL
jgi:hypothetical protein